MSQESQNKSTTLVGAAVGAELGGAAGVGATAGAAGAGAASSTVGAASGSSGSLATDGGDLLSGVLGDGGDPLPTYPPAGWRLAAYPLPTYPKFGIGTLPYPPKNPNPERTNP